MKSSPQHGAAARSHGKAPLRPTTFVPAFGPSGRRPSAFIQKLTAAAALLVSFVAAPAASAIPSSTPDATWGTNARVSAIVQSGNVVYLGGSFTEVRENGGGGPGVLPRTYLAAFDATTGAPIAGWAPSLNGEVRALALSPDGRRLYAGGAFTKVDGATRYRTAAIDIATGKLDTTWKSPAANSTVTAVAATGTRVYIGGQFTTVGGQTRSRLAALSATTGALDSTWRPVANALVRTLAFSANGTRLLAGGDFTTVAGQARRNVAALDPMTGAVFADWHPDPGYPILALAVTDATVYGAGGGSGNTLAAWNATTGAREWSRHADGDFQALAVSGDMVYAGGHFNYFEGELHRKLVAVDGRTGSLRRDWNPILPATSPTWGGVWGMSAWGGTRLAVGGDFDSVNGARQEHYAQFTGSLNGAGGDTSPPTPPANLTAGAIGGSRVDVTWSAGTDSDGVAEYRIFRDGVQIATTGTTSYSDATVTSSTTYTYYVVAVDFAGNTSSPSGTATVTTAPPDETVTFPVSDDAYVASAAPDTNNGSATSVEVDADPVKDFLLKFNVSGMSGREIVSAKIRLYAVDGSTNGGDFRRVSDSSWSEGSVTWNTAPTRDAVITSVLNDPAANRWYDVDVTPLVTGDGAVSVRVSSVSTNGAAYASKERGADLAPRLVVTLADPSANVPPRRVFSDGFESGDLSRWTSSTGLRAQQEDVSSGAWAARATSSGTAAYASKQLPTSYSELHTQIRVKPLSHGANTVILQRLATGTGASILRLFLTSAGTLAYRNDVTGATTTSSSVVGQGSWHTLQVHAVVNDAASQVEVWLDGARIDALSKTLSLGTTPIGRLVIGDDATGKTYGVVFDDVVADRAALGG
jgi:hypothetical protein